MLETVWPLLVEEERRNNGRASQDWDDAPYSARREMRHTLHFPELTRLAMLTLPAGLYSSKEEIAFMCRWYGRAVEVVE